MDMTNRLKTNFSKLKKTKRPATEMGINLLSNNLLVIVLYNLCAGPFLDGALSKARRGVKKLLLKAVKPIDCRAYASPRHEVEYGEDEAASRGVLLFVKTTADNHLAGLTSARTHRSFKFLLGVATSCRRLTPGVGSLS